MATSAQKKRNPGLREKQSERRGIFPVPVDEFAARLPDTSFTCARQADLPGHP
jgi:hypothetical protein